MSEYHKIFGPFKRATEGPNKNKVIFGSWTTPEFMLLAETDWGWKEKLDGTNIRVIWNGHSVAFAGRTDRANIPTQLLEHLRATLPEELLEQTFGATPAILYGEGVGKGIQKGGERYFPDQRFVLFDVYVKRLWLKDESVATVASQLGIPVVTEGFIGSVFDAIETVRAGENFSRFGEFQAEGLVGTPLTGLLARNGARIIMKVKEVDFRA